MNHQYRIQRQQIVNPLMGVEEPLFEFTFLATPYEERTPAQRMDEMTAFIRQTLLQHYNFEPNDPHTFLVQWFPSEYVYEYRRQRTFGRVATIQGDTFMAIYNGMLQSDQTIEIVGMRISVQWVGSRMNHEVYGAGCTPGARTLPPHLKLMGLVTNPLVEKHQYVMEEVKLCGLLAALCLKDSKYLEKTHFWDWLEAAKRLGTMLSITDGIVKNEHFQQLLHLPGWETYRIIIFSNTRGLHAVFQGPDW